MHIPREQRHALTACGKRMTTENHALSPILPGKGGAVQEITLCATILYLSSYASPLLFTPRKQWHPKRKVHCLPVLFRPWQPTHKYSHGERTILEFCILQLQQKRQQANQVVEEVLGPEATFPLRPWALLFTKNKTALEQALQSMSQDMKADGSRWADRRWLEGIRIWWAILLLLHQRFIVFCLLLMDDQVPLRMFHNWRLCSVHYIYLVVVADQICYPGYSMNMTINHPVLLWWWICYDWSPLYLMGMIAEMCSKWIMM